MNSILLHVNGFCFCEHGYEYCDQCYTDHRMTNNFHDNDLRTKVSKKLGPSFDFNNRKTLNVFELGAIPTGLTDEYGEPSYKCTTHDTSNCTVCFDWPKAVLAKERMREGHIEDRTELLGLLSILGIEMPRETKLSTGALNKKLEKALDSAQRIESIANFIPVEPDILPKWKDSTSRPTLAAMPRRSIAEAMQNYRALVASELSDPFPLHQDAFLDMLRTLLHMADNFDDGHRIAIIRDEKDTRAMCMHVIEAYALDKDTPLFIVLFCVDGKNTPQHPIHPFVQELLLARELPNVPTIYATPQEQLLLSKLLYTNVSRVSETYKPPRRANEGPFSVSFFVPIGPPSPTDIGHISSNTGCIICGKRLTMRCSQCHGVGYCGSVCQQAHWKEHKLFCRSLKDGIWRTMQISLDPPHMPQGGVASILNVHGQTEIDPNITVSNDNIPPPDIHGDKPFIVKIQVPVTGDPRSSNPLVYDRQRSFRAFLHGGDPAAKPEIVAAISEESTPKIYRWARRVGDFELSICLDRKPATTPNW
ncbi:hypothetical protein FISHEDRAFT_43183 [Fistulina hepatica ATCC 64428]|uniref:MYND-type domain-containing protein n=1 Tax=Fistulina hepatica ATCC 64428 TaxID=1128425 RepID=A0A0D7AC19_9AGAR|nr:hypothetical protein FISHEDRAFT_43183 [Fistulina hepatica ATCC 64428]